jgi:hypothetical protein
MLCLGSEGERATLTEHLEAVTTRVIAEVLHADDAEAEVRKELPSATSQEA